MVDLTLYAQTKSIGLYTINLSRPRREYNFKIFEIFKLLVCWKIQYIDTPMIIAKTCHRELGKREGQREFLQQTVRLVSRVAPVCASNVAPLNVLSSVSDHPPVQVTPGVI